jgi:hypothetical protein
MAALVNRMELSNEQRLEFGRVGYDVACASAVPGVQAVQTTG